MNQPVHGYSTFHLQAKISGLQVTARALEYDDSIIVGAPIPAAASTMPFMEVEVCYMRNKNRWHTYAMAVGKGTDCALAGPTSNQARLGDELVVMAWVVIYGPLCDPALVCPSLVRTDENNIIQSAHSPCKNPVVDEQDRRIRKAAEKCLRRQHQDAPVTIRAGGSA